MKTSSKLVSKFVPAIIFLTLPILAFAQAPGSNTQLPNPLASNLNSIEAFVTAILTNIVLPIGSVVVVFFIIYSGYLFVTARGNESQLEKAKHTFMYVLIGAAILLGASAIALAVKGTLCQIAPTLCGGTPTP